MKFLIASFLFIFSLALGANVRASFDFPQEHTKEILVKYKNQEKIEVARAEGELAEALRKYNQNPEIEYAEPNYHYYRSIIPSDTHYTKQWYLKKIKAVEAWDKKRNAEDIVIAILDSGAQINHPDLRDNIWRNAREAPGNQIDDDKNGLVDDVNGWDFINNSPDPSPKFQEGFTEAGILHGTIIAGIAAASGNNAGGVAGVSWRAKIMPLKVLDDAGVGRTDKVVKGIDYAIEKGAHIINLSFVAFNRSRSLEKAIERAHKAGVIIVAAAGNEQSEGKEYSLDDVPMYPACNDGPNGENWVIGVAATDTLDQKAPFSSYGFRCVDIAAPGVSIFGASVYEPTKRIGDAPFNKYYDGYWSGTSMAVPMISGALALLISANPAMDKSEITKILLDSSDNISRLNPGYLGQLGRGRLNVMAAIDQASEFLSQKEYRVITAPETSYQSIIRRTRQNGIVENEFLAYGENFLGGANVAGCDFGNGEEKIIAGAGIGGGPHVRIFNQDGIIENQFFAYNPNFRGGAQVACADLDNDGEVEIITGAGFGGGPQVRIFSRKGKVLGQFFAYNENFRGGVNIAAGDIDGDGKAEIITGAGKGGGPQVRIFDNKGKALGQFWAYEKDYRGGARIALGNIRAGTRDAKKEIITAPGAGHASEIRVYDNHGARLENFMAYGENFLGGVNVATADMDQDGLDDVITGAGPGGTPHVRVFNAKGKLINSFFAYPKEYSGGVKVAKLLINND